MGAIEQSNPQWYQALTSGLTEIQGKEEISLVVGGIDTNYRYFRYLGSGYRYR